MAESFRGTGAGAPNFVHPFLAALKSSLNSYRLDEGYSEDTRSQAGSELRTDLRMGDLGDAVPLQGLLPDWVSGMTEVERSEFAYLFLRSLRTSSIARIVDRLYPLLHIDPINHLPPEIIFEILSYLDPQTLLSASTLSRTWRTRTLDARLWRRLFGSEGWSVNTPGVRQFEDEQRVRNNPKGKARARPSEDLWDPESKSPKRRIRGKFTLVKEEDGDNPMMLFDSSLDARPWAEQHGAVEADEDEKMEDAGPLERDDSSMQDVQPTVSSSMTVRQVDQASAAQKSLLIYLPDSTESRLNWQHLYKQKRRLEENWIAGKYTNFQLPHPNYPNEAHSECVYTIQYSRKHLVSGSRDHTLRIWDLDTQRLTVPPLRGHSASVLCLQFDDRPCEDIVMSGGSDCNVILWRFSTGKMIRKLKQAHAESVLNLRFDARVLVTCSKDKTIKVWTRQSILPTDDAYPQPGRSTSARFPPYILHVADLVDNKLAMKPLEEYSLLMTLYGHTAAVNAIQIRDNQIVSASGDRHVKVWNVKTGVCIKTIPGHLKGIACVQFDGRRIVSGSSDETVRIFDRSTAAEVACLRGHTNLVRTVQARFGDGPDSALEDEAEAKALDRKYFAAKISGQFSPKEKPLSKEERRARNAGGKEPKDASFAIGAKLPPGGGGSRWARIVSGSYDETVIIWKRNAENKWVPAHHLYQWQAVLNAGGQLRFVAAQQRPGDGQAGAGQPAAGAQPNVNPHANHQQQQQQQQHAQAQGGAHHAQAQPAPGHAQSLMGYVQNIVNQHQGGSVQAGANIAVGSHGAGASSNAAAPGASSSVGGAMGSPAAPLTIQSQSLPQQQHPARPSAIQASSSSSQGPSRAQQQAPTAPAVPPFPHNVPVNTGNPAAQQQVGQPAAHAHPQQPNANAAGNAAHHHHHPHHHQHTHAALHGGMQLAGGTNSRVFKLQFDSRRIICCSQDPTIVGWDFANGDQEIIRASQFFGDD